MKLKVFLSYSHKDEKLKEELDIQFAMLKRNDLIETWNDRYLTAGSELDEEVLDNLNNSQVILLLLSPDFLASYYCYEKEMAIALEKKENGSAIVIPIILRRCDWPNSPLKNLVGLPNDGIPINSWTDKDEAFFNVKDGVEKAVKKFGEKLNP